MATINIYCAGDAILREHLMYLSQMHNLLGNPTRANVRVSVFFRKHPSNTISVDVSLNKRERANEFKDEFLEQIEKYIKIFRPKCVVDVATISRSAMRRPPRKK